METEQTSLQARRASRPVLHGERKAHVAKRLAAHMTPRYLTAVEVDPYRHLKPGSPVYVVTTPEVRGRILRRGDEEALVEVVEGVHVGERLWYRLDELELFEDD